MAGLLARGFNASVFLQAHFNRKPYLQTLVVHMCLTMPGLQHGGNNTKFGHHHHI
jgi:hypothetical protein